MAFRLNIPLHHAHCLEGDITLIKNSLVNFLEKEIGFKTKGNPDFWLGEFEKFGIDESRFVIDFQNRKSLGDKKIIVIRANSMSSEAQNSLLKTLEEPHPNTHFFLILESSEILLPTLKSRLVIERFRSEKTDDNFAKNFFETSGGERLEMLKEIIEEKDKVQAIHKINELESFFRNQMKLEQTKEEDIVFLETIIKFRSYLNDRAPSVKMLLEHIALITPKL